MAIPRVIVELESLKDCAYDLKYHNKLQGFVYNLLKATPYENIHDKNGYKHFCFSGIMPPFDKRAAGAFAVRSWNDFLSFHYAV